MPAPYALLKVHGPLAGKVLEAAHTLKVIEEAYLQLYAADIYLDSLYRIYAETPRRFPNALRGLGLLIFWFPPDRRIVLSSDIRKYMVPADEELALASVEFSSPGFWEFLGALNPLEQLRKYLNDRHERKKDDEYRNEAERRRLHADSRKLEIENDLLSVELFETRAKALRGVGLSDEDIREILIPTARSLDAVARVQDQGLIENAEIRRIEGTGAGDVANSAESPPST